jgi:succinoglycan biosynthesis protein ExoA
MLSALPPDPTVSVVVPARYAAATLEKAVLSALAQGPMVNEVVIAVGDPDTARVAEQLAVRYPRVRIVDNPAGGTSTGLNAAVAASTGQVVVRLDAHAMLPEGYVGIALEALARSGAANVGGRQVATADKGFARAVAIAMRSPVGSGGAAYRSSVEAGPTDTVYLGVFRRETLEAVGGFDERFVRNQDAELNERLRAHGHVVWFEPALEVAYRPRGTVRALARQYAAYGRWRRATARRHPGSLRLRQIAAPTLVLGLVGLAVASALAGTPWPLVVGAGAYLAAVVIAGFAAAGRPIVGLQVALALLTMHLSWGVGFLAGPPRITGGDVDAEAAAADDPSEPPSEP